MGKKTKSHSPFDMNAKPPTVKASRELRQITDLTTAGAAVVIGAQTLNYVKLIE